VDVYVVIVIKFVVAVVGGDRIIETLNTNVVPDTAADARALPNETVFPNLSQLKIDFRAVPETFVQVVLEYRGGYRVETV
jgi:hypothetical protein